MSELILNLKGVIVLHEIGEYSLERTTSLLEYYLKLYILKKKDIVIPDIIAGQLKERGYNIKL